MGFSNRLQWVEGGFMDLTKNIAYYRPPNALFTKKIIYKLVYHILPDRIIQEVS